MAKVSLLLSLWISGSTATDAHNLYAATGISTLLIPLMGEQNMSKLAEFRELEAALAQQLKNLEQLKNDQSLTAEIEFEEKIRALMAEYGKSLRDVIAIVEPHYRTTATRPAAPAKRRARQLKRYTNPHTGESVETKGGNHKALKAWKQKYGAETVESWLN